MLKPLEVVWIPDDTIRPPAPKMVVCVSPEDGWFYRINSRGHHRPSLAVVRIPDHLFLDHDSFLEVGEPLELDDYIIEESLRQRGVIGSISKALCAGIIGYLASARFLTERDRQKIRDVLRSI